MYIGILISMLVYSNIVNKSVFDALSIGSGLVAAVLRCIKRDELNGVVVSFDNHPSNHPILHILPVKYSNKEPYKREDIFETNSEYKRTLRISRAKWTVRVE